MVAAYTSNIAACAVIGGLITYTLGMWVAFYALRSSLFEELTTFLFCCPGLGLRRNALLLLSFGDNLLDKNLFRHSGRRFMLTIIASSLPINAFVPQDAPG